MTPMRLLKGAASVGIAMVVFGFAGCTGSAPKGWTGFGEQRSQMDSPVALAALDGTERDVVISGTIADVCKIKGCWMNVQDNNGTEMFVQFENYGFFVPMNSTGQAVKAHGRAVKQAWSVEELRHFAEDAHKSPTEIAAINQPKTRVTFLADSVWIEDSGLDSPPAE
jgi:hypothetical protein